MDYQQKAAALAALGELSVKFRESENRIGIVSPWHCSQPGVEVREPPSLLKGCYGNGRTPQEAIEDHWKVLVEDLGPTEYIVINAMRSSRRAVRWNGFMWAAIDENRDAA